MARSFNQVILLGNLTRDPELRQTPHGVSVCSFSMAVNRSYKDKSGEWKELTDFFDIVAWGPLGERIAQWQKRGSKVLVTGRLQSRSWEKEGQKHIKVEVVAGDVVFLSADKQTETVTQKEVEESEPKKDDVVIEDIGEEPINLDDIPF